MIKKSCINLPTGKNNNREKATYSAGEYREEKKLEQIHLAIGFEGIDLHHEDYYSLDIYASLLGGGMSSRLFQEIREKRGLVYSIMSGNIFFEDAGILIIDGNGSDLETTSYFLGNLVLFHLIYL